MSVLLNTRRIPFVVVVVRDIGFYLQFGVSSTCNSLNRFLSWSFINNSSANFGAKLWTNERALTSSDRILTWELVTLQEVILTSVLKFGSNGHKSIFGLNIWIDMTAWFA
jgi:hypothetical protein